MECVEFPAVIGKYTLDKVLYRQHNDCVIYDLHDTEHVMKIKVTTNQNEIENYKRFDILYDNGIIMIGDITYTWFVMEKYERPMNNTDDMHIIMNVYLKMVVYI